MSSDSDIENLFDEAFFNETGLDKNKNLVGPVALQNTLNYTHESIIEGDHHLVSLVEYIQNRFNKESFDFKIAGLSQVPSVAATNNIELSEVARFKEYKFLSIAVILEKLKHSSQVCSSICCL